MAGYGPCPQRHGLLGTSGTLFVQEINVLTQHHVMTSSDSSPALPLERRADWWRTYNGPVSGPSVSWCGTTGLFQSRDCNLVLNGHVSTGAAGLGGWSCKARADF